MYGLPKLRQLVTPIGSPPLHTIFRAASATAIAAPACGLAYTYRLLQSTVIANALPVPLASTMAASLGALVLILAAPTILSYCTLIQPLLAILGSCINCAAICFNSSTSVTSAKLLIEYFSISLK